MKRCYRKAIYSIIQDKGGSCRSLLNESYLTGTFSHDSRTFGYWIDLASRYQEITLNGKRIINRLNDNDTAAIARERIINDANRLIMAALKNA